MLQASSAVRTFVKLFVSALSPTGGTRSAARTPKRRLAAPARHGRIRLFATIPRAKH
jgi:hypothetical protein